MQNQQLPVLPLLPQMISALLCICEFTEHEQNGINIANAMALFLTNGYSSPSSVSRREEGDGLHTPSHCKFRRQRQMSFPKCFVRRSSDTHTHLLKYSFSNADLYFHKTGICISKEITSLSKESFNFVCLKCFHLRPNLEQPATCLHHQPPAEQQKLTSYIHCPAGAVGVTGRREGFSIGL